jgi:hypothetical protein
MPSPELTVPLTATGAEETRQSSLPNQTIWFAQLRAGASGSCSFCVWTHFGDSARESTTSSTSCMKGGNSGNNGSEFDMADRKAFEAYCTNLEELFLSHCEVMRQGTVL